MGSARGRKGAGRVRAREWGAEPISPTPFWTTQVPGSSLSSAVPEEGEAAAAPGVCVGGSSTAPHLFRHKEAGDVEGLKHDLGRLLSRLLGGAEGARMRRRVSFKRRLQCRSCCVRSRVPNILITAVAGPSRGGCSSEARAVPQATSRRRGAAPEAFGGSAVPPEIPPSPLN